MTAEAIEALKGFDEGDYWTPASEVLEEIEGEEKRWLFSFTTDLARAIEAKDPEWAGNALEKLSMEIWVDFPDLAKKAALIGNDLRLQSLGLSSLFN